MTRPTRSLAVLLSLSGLMGCGGGGGGGPQGPGTPDPPVVTSVTPAEARAGEPVTIAGQNFGSDAGAVTVTFGGVQATVTSVAPTSIRATVPTVPTGDAPVVVTVSGRSSGEFAFRVLASPPVITSIDPDPVVAGEPLTILGSDFTAAVAIGLALAQGTVSVLIDGDPVQILSVSSSSITVDVPFGLPAGVPHELVVQQDGLTSEPFAFDSRLPLFDGTYLGQADVTVNTCGQGTPAGESVTSGIAVLDFDGDGDLDLFVNGRLMVSEIDPVTGEISFQGPDDGANGFSLEGNGRFQVAEDEDLQVEYEFGMSPSDDGCRIEGFFEAPRRPGFAFPVAIADISLQNLEPPGPVPVPLPTGQVRETDVVDPLLGTSNGRVEVGCDGGPCFIEPGPNGHLGVPGGSELFVRIAGPRPNGFLWPTFVRFTTSRVTVTLSGETGVVKTYDDVEPGCRALDPANPVTLWNEMRVRPVDANGFSRVEEVGTVTYHLDAVGPGADELSGLFDRTGFCP